MARLGSKTSDRTLETIAALYDAALDQTLWPVALAKLTRLTSSQASTFWVLAHGRSGLQRVHGQRPSESTQPGTEDLPARAPTTA